MHICSLAAASDSDQQSARLRARTYLSTGRATLATRYVRRHIVVAAQGSDSWRPVPARPVPTLLGAGHTYAATHRAQRTKRAPRPMQASEAEPSAASADCSAFVG